MVDKDELAWMHMNSAETQQAALVKQMQESQEYEHYKNTCLLFTEGVKGLRKQYPNDTEFGNIIGQLIKKML